MSIGKVLESWTFRFSLQSFDPFGQILEKSTMVSKRRRMTGAKEARNRQVFPFYLNCEVCLSALQAMLRRL